MKHLYAILFFMVSLSYNADAAIVFTDLSPDAQVSMVVDPTFGTGSGSALSPLDINNDGVADFNFRYNVSPGFGWFLHIVELNNNAVIRTMNNSVTIANPYAVVLNDDDFIGQNLNWSSTVEPLIGDTTDYNFGGQGDRYIGVRLLIAGNQHYGWIRVSFDNTASPQLLTIQEFAYEDVAGVPIAAGQTTGPPPVPEIEFSQAGVVLSVLDSFDFGMVANGSTQDAIFQIKNTGTTSLNLSNFLISTGNTGDFSVTPPNNLSVGANDSVEFTVSFSPTVNGQRATLLSFDTNDDDEPTFNIDLVGETGMGNGNNGGTTEIADLLITQDGVILPISQGGNYNFDSTEIGMSNTDTFYLHNTNQTEVLILDVLGIIDFINPNAFTSDLMFPVIIAPGDSVEWRVTFSPTDLGLNVGPAFIENFASNGTLNFTFLGEGVGDVNLAPSFVLTDGNVNLLTDGILDFGDVPIGFPVTKNLVLKTQNLNDSVEIVQLDLFSFAVGGEVEEFTVNDTIVVLYPGDSLIIPITFDPTDPIDYSTIFFITTDFFSPLAPIDIEVLGRGVSPIPVESIVVYGENNIEEIELIPGTLQMIADILPLTTTFQEVEWSVSDTNIALISETGLLQAKTVGTVSVIATSMDGNSIMGSTVINIINSVGINSISDQQIRVYPNPTDGFLNIPSGLEITGYNIYSIDGKEVQTGKVSINTINTKNLSKGIYFLKLNSINKSFVAKFRR